MPKMTLFWVLTYAFGLVMSFINPFYGVLTYIFEYYLRPSLHWWGKDLPDFRWNLAIALVLTATFMIRRASLPQIVNARRGPAICLLILAAWMLLVTQTIAVNPDQSWDKVVSYLKFILFHGLVVGTVRSEWAFDMIVAAHMTGAGWWGWEAFRDPNRESGRLVNIGSGDTLGDNAASAHLLTVIPFLVVYALVHKDKRLRALGIVFAPFVINAFILCNSRGALLALVVATISALLLAKSGHRMRSIGAAVLVGGVLLSLADVEFLERQQSTTRYQDDGSAGQRLVSWQGGFELIKDYPFGTGGTGFAELSPIYIPEVVALEGEKRDPHNTVVLVGSEWGLIGLALYFGYYFSCFLLLREVRKRAAQGGIWYYRSLAIQIAMIGVFIAGLFTDRLYAEAPYWMGALAVALHRIQTHQLAEKESDQRESSGAASPEGGKLTPVAARVATAPVATSRVRLT